MDSYLNAYRGRRVLVTGHTGFKGAWLSEWLLLLGAEVRGYSLAPPTTPALFEQLGLSSRMAEQRADVGDRNALATAVRAYRPDFVFHLAAQPLVRRSYDQPWQTWTTNVLGTVNMLEALRTLTAPCAVVIVTSDKCYASRNPARGYTEDDPLGGSDPYSSSKAAAEMAVTAWRRSFFPAGGIARAAVAPVGLATGRAGNVIGGGDWAADRIVPDSIRSLMRSDAIAVRNPNAVRPWQHVLESLSGYLLLAARLYGALTAKPAPSETKLQALAAPFNFGPRGQAERNVRDLVEEILRHWPGRWSPMVETGAPNEEQRLHLDSTRAETVLGWRPRWNFQQTVAHTAEWYRAVADNPTFAPELTRRQIKDYMNPSVS